MSAAAPHALLLQARELSRELLAAVDRADLPALGRLDAERLLLLKSFRTTARRVEPADHALLAEIAAMNDRALGLVEHLRRIKGRAMDMAAVGRRAVAAYAVTGAARAGRSAA